MRREIVEEEVEDEGETRCICGELEPPDDSGFFIQCETCNVWQHGVCVGISNSNGDKPPDKYWCEQCRPELHRLYYTNDTGELRSAYKLVQPTKRKNRRHPSGSRARRNNKRDSTEYDTSTDNLAEEESKLDPEEDSESTAASATSNTGTGQRKRRKTSNTSDTTDDLKNNGAIEEEDTLQAGSPANETEDTTNQDHPQAQDDDDQSRETQQEENDAVKQEPDLGDEEDETGLTNDTTINETADDSTTTIAAEATTEAVKEEAEAETNADDTTDDHITNATNAETDSNEGTDVSKIISDRKRATLVAREEKHYQWMLEKALQESRKTSNQEEGNKQESRPVPTSKENSPTSDSNTSRSSSRNKDEAAKELSNEKETQDKVSDDLQPNETNTVSSEDDNKAKNLRRSQRSGNTPRNSGKGRNSRKQNSKASSANGSDNDKNKTADIGINKPVKPRLPPPRTTLNEMRRRVTAIMEFLSRTQWELEAEIRNKEDLTKFVENEQFVKETEVIFDNTNKNLSLMNDLTKKLINWETKYSVNEALE
ncbi:PHD-finger [Nakaseomyces glabratus]|nr:PHD-finger [Nakaseomyces glabratus]KAH7597372.1 PHD-finger [Nakaseomyces glabratus]